MCYFCEEGRDFSVAKRKLGANWPFENEVIYSDENVFVIVGSAPQVVPYLLILPYRHIYSITEMTYAEKNSFMLALNYLSGRGGFSSELCFFEHGGKSESGSSSIDHCHVHVIDGKIGLYYQKRYDSFQKYTNVIPTICDSYLMVGKYYNGGFELKVSTSTIAHERQFFRRRISEIIGEDQWDWRIDDRLDKMIEIMNGFLDAN